MSSDKPKRGGARPGAGRKKKDPGVRFTFYLPEDHAKRLEGILTKEEVTAYEWCQKQILKALDETGR